MDNARWWNTNGQLGSYGRMALRRGFPRTHYFAQARAVFAVATQRCREIFDPPACVTLWTLPAETEEEFDARWEHWLDTRQDWEPFFQQVETLAGADLTGALHTLSLATRISKAWAVSGAPRRAVPSFCLASSPAQIRTSRSSPSALPVVKSRHSRCRTSV
jgi:hypothetical protein